MEEDILEFSQEWLTLDKYQFKILTMVTVLADNQKAYRGKLSDLCQYLSIKPVTGNINNIKSTLTSLTGNGYVNIMIDKDIYTISLSKAAEKKEDIIKIKRAWYKTICSINFVDFKFQKEVVKKHLENGGYQTLGTIYNQGIYFE